MPSSSSRYASVATIEPCVELKPQIRRDHRCQFTQLQEHSGDNPTASALFRILSYVEHVLPLCSKLYRRPCVPKCDWSIAGFDMCLHMLDVRGSLSTASSQEWCPRIWVGCLSCTQVKFSKGF